jgi:hypothetical protein
MIVGLCVLFLVAQGSAAAKVESTNENGHVVRHHLHALSLRAQLERELRLAHKERSVVHFFRTHRWLLRSKDHRVVARKTFVHAERRLARTTRRIRRLRHAIHVQAIRRLRSAPPKVAICAVFKRDCGQAMDVAWCESRLNTTAENGQYLGLFQMGYTARRLFGHGPTALAQSVAAHRYFVYTGRDWSPWSCKPSTAY